MSCVAPAHCQVTDVRRRAFTLVEIMVVVSIIGLLAAVAIQSLLRSRAVSMETAAIANLRTLTSSLEMYQASNSGYPDAWQAEMYTNANPTFGPPTFNTAMASSLVQGYLYTYTPLPAGCSSTCSAYTLSGVPQLPGLTGTRALFVDRSGIIRHCTGPGTADATDQPIEQPPAPCG